MSIQKTSFNELGIYLPGAHNWLRLDCCKYVTFIREIILPGTVQYHCTGYCIFLLGEGSRLHLSSTFRTCSRAFFLFLPLAPRVVPDKALAQPLRLQQH
jgi:hypothetical protein